MANSTTSERLWILTDAAVIADAGTPVIVRKIVFTPAAIDNEVLIQEYDSSGSLRTGIKLKANHTDVNLVSLDWGRKGRTLNGFKLATISAGTLDIYLGRD